MDNSGVLGPSPFDGDASSLDASVLDASSDAALGADAMSDARSTIDAPPSPPPLVRGLAIQNIAMFQAVKVFLVNQGVAVAKTNAPIIAGRPGRLRIYVTADATWQTHDVLAELHVTSIKSPQPVVSMTTSVAAGSNLAPIDFDLTAAQLPADAAFSVVLRDPSMPPSGGDDAGGAVVDGGIVGGRYPVDGTAAPLHAIGKSILKVQLVPVRYDADGSHRTPNFDATQVANYHDWLYKMYPVSEVQITVHAPMPYGAYVGATDGWDQLLGAIASLRAVDHPSVDTYYLGAFMSADSFNSFCGGGCYAGLGYVASADALDQHAAIVLGFPGDIGPSAATQELAHAMGRWHAPCGNPSGVDSSYPYADASIGVWGFDVLKKTFVDPSQYKDFMSYCSPTWSSDYTFQALSDRMAIVNGPVQQMPRAPARHEIVDVRADGTLRWTRATTMTAAPSGEEFGVRFVDAKGNVIERATAHLVRYDAFDGGVLILPDVPAAASAVVVLGLRGAAQTRARREVR
jgi:hypothetical protein